MLARGKREGAGKTRLGAFRGGGIDGLCGQGIERLGGGEDDRKTHQAQYGQPGQHEAPAFAGKYPGGQESAEQRGQPGPARISQKQREQDHGSGEQVGETGLLAACGGEEGAQR